MRRADVNAVGRRDISAYNVDTLTTVEKVALRMNRINSSAIAN